MQEFSDDLHELVIRNTEALRALIAETAGA